MSDAEIKLYIADHVSLGLEERWKVLFENLPEKYRERIGRFRFDADRIRGTLGTVMIRHFERTEHGKPFLYGHDGFEFSLSHSGDMVVLAVSGRAVGADVETVKGRDWEMFDRFLSEAEMKMIGEAEDPEEKFFEVWTVREAFSKEEGLGLKILDSDFTVDYSKREINYSGKKLNFYSFDHTAEDRYKLSICSAKEVAEPEISFLSTEDWERCLREGLFSEIK